MLEVKKDTDADTVHLSSICYSLVPGGSINEEEVKKRGVRHMSNKPALVILGVGFVVDDRSLLRRSFVLRALPHNCRPTHLPTSPPISTPPDSFLHIHLLFPTL